jgi:hypothetical protein
MFNLLKICFISLSFHLRREPERIEKIRPDIRKSSPNQGILAFFRARGIDKPRLFAYDKG